MGSGIQDKFGVLAGYAYNSSFRNIIIQNTVVGSQMGSATENSAAGSLVGV